MIGDQELLAFRLGYYDLLVGLLWREPADELVDALPHGLEERRAAARALHPRLGEGWDAIARFCADVPAPLRAETVRDEYTRLFVGPGTPELSLYESHYLTGRLLDRPLAVLRETLAGLGIAKDPAYSEPEDFLAFELEVVRALLRRQAGAADASGETDALSGQATFLKRHLLVWGPAAAADLAASRARFYPGVGLLLDGFLATELDLVRDWGPEAPMSLAAARARFAGRREFAGQVFEVSESGPGQARPRGCGGGDD